MKSKWLTPRTRIFHKTRIRRREETDGCGLSPTPPPHVRGYHVASPSAAGETSLRILLRLALLGALISTQLFAANDWPEFRGPTAEGHSPAKNVPIHWSATSNVVWKAAIPGESWSSPVLVDGRIYLTTAVTDGTNTSLRALCVDAKNGRIEWDVEIFQPKAEATQAMHKKNSLASPTAIVRDGRVYVHFGHMGTAALDLLVKILWRQTELK